MASLYDSYEKKNCWIINRMFEFCEIMELSPCVRSELGKKQFNQAMKKFGTVAKWLDSQCFFMEWEPTEEEQKKWMQFGPTIELNPDEYL